MKKILLFLFLLTPFALSAQQNLLQSGPMVGYTEMREALLWVQTSKAATVQFAYWDSLAPAKKFYTEKVTTAKNSGFTAKLIADEVQPGRKYLYDLMINGKKISRPYPTSFRTPPLWQYRTDPPDFSFAIGSCTYVNDSLYDRPGRPYGGEYRIFTSIAQKRPDIMIWGGDNVYLREADWNTRTGIIYRYTHGRSVPEIQPLLAASANYAVWDDHDFGPNDADRGFWNKENTFDIFRLFWGNPSYGVNGQPGITTQFEYGDVQFFLLDNRYHRSPDNRVDDRQLLGKDQLNWLIDALTTSRANFKVVVIGGQVLNPVARFETYATYAEEQKMLLDRIAANKIPGVLFISGDRHHTELSRLNREGTYPLYDLTISPLTSGPSTLAKDEKNTLRVDSTVVAERNFCVANTYTLPTNDPKRKDRAIRFTVYNADGKELWKREIKASELR